MSVQQYHTHTHTRQTHSIYTEWSHFVRIWKNAIYKILIKSRFICKIWNNANPKLKDLSVEIARCMSVSVVSPVPSVSSECDIFPTTIINKTKWINFFLLFLALQSFADFSLFQFQKFVSWTYFYGARSAPRPTPQPGEPGYPTLSGSQSLTCMAWETASIALRIKWLRQSRDTFGGWGFLVN